VTNAVESNVDVVLYVATFCFITS